ncbi:hypothetical protein [Streptomyces rubellomurinus]|uniref:Lipoprotein n=1 Tax=Streptomyces rubellomurinus (strain ATCC 31215) TaxID=359131 RepID=A0A0F2TFN9_STRR3|nr:hypothetical protein [Streptomyces rubellomurinus]KJS61964.1 hypothetical protein VM95_11450 [Streptomyces rubellomurinus]
MIPIKLATTAGIAIASLALACFASDLVSPSEPATADVVWWTTLAAALMTGINRHNNSSDDDD